MPTSHHPAHRRRDQDHHDDISDLLDLDAEVLRDYWSAALSWVRTAAVGSAPTQLADLGAGTGTAAIRLAQLFGDARVVAVDLSPLSLQRLRAKALDLGLAPRIRTLVADLDVGWPDLETLDLTWASMSLHHLADPARVLTDALAATRPGGLIAVAEFEEPLRFLPEQLRPDPGGWRPGFEDRALAALRNAAGEAAPSLSPAWAPQLAAAGWTVLDERDFVIDLVSPTTPRAGRYAHGWFTRLSLHLAQRLEPDDQAALAGLLDDHGPHALLRRTDLHLRGTRTVTLARRD